MKSLVELQKSRDLKDMACQGMKTYSATELLFRLFGQAKGYRVHLAGVLALRLLGTPLTLLTPVPIKIIVDSVVGSDPLPGYIAFAAPEVVTISSSGILAVAIALFLLVSLLSLVRAFTATYLNIYTAQKLVLKLRAELFSRIQRLSLRYHDQKGSTDSTYRIQYDASSIQQVILGGLIPISAACFSLVGIVSVTAMIDIQLTLIALGVCPILFFLVNYFNRRLRKKWKAVKSLESSSMSVVQEVLSTLRVVKAFGREDSEEERFVSKSNQRIAEQLGAVRTGGIYDFLVGATVSAATATVLLIGTLHVQSGVLSLGELLMVIAYMAQIFGPLRSISNTATRAASGLASAERVFSLFDQQPELVDKPGALRITKAKGDIRLENVKFSYQENNPVLKDITLEIPAGSRVGLRGTTGAGKSTLVSLLMRFYDPDYGRISLDGVDICDYRHIDLRNQFAIMLQDPVLFSTTIAENISYGRPGASPEEVEAAARLAHAHEFISGLSDGYETQVGERGVKLSGGERQRVSLARAFLRDAPILILDEPTSSVDMSTEAVIIDAIENLMLGRTTITIAHRLSTLENCDVIFELESGRITRI